MSDCALITGSHAFRKFRTVNATDNGFPSKLITATKPAPSIGSNAAQATSPAVIQFGDGGPYSQNSLLLKLFGAGANNNTFSMRLIMWTPIVDQDQNNDVTVYDPTDLFEVQATLSSTLVGLAGKVVAATDLFADTITITGTTAIANVNVTVNSPANDRPAYILVDGLGGKLIEAIFSTGGSATSCNSLWRPM